MHTRDLIEKEFAENRRLYVARATHRGWGHMAEDIVQETFTRALTYERAYDQSKPIQGWITRIMQNVILDAHAEENGRGTSSQYDDDIGVEALNIPQEEYEEAQREILKQVFSMKTKEERDVCNYYFRLGFKPREILQLTELKYDRISYIIQAFQKEFNRKNKKE